MGRDLLDIRALEVWYRTYQGFAKVVDGVNLHVDKGEKVGLVGESGCGKTTTMKSVLRVLDEKKSHVPAGEIIFKERDVRKMGYAELQQFRRRSVSMISQEPSAALNPVFTVGQQMLDVIGYSLPDGQAKSKADMMEMAIKEIGRAHV
jgi:peptide/nickel transport system ATP-binding protein